MLIDFTEIPAGNKSGQEQDLFELFAREFLLAMDFAIIEDPSRGPDGGKDLLVEETRPGITGDHKIRWLVSCKHNAHSGRAVGSGEEIDIGDRVNTAKANGFLGFYSMVPSTGLMQKFKSNLGVETYHFDSEKLERHLTTNRDLEMVFRRFFRRSYDQFRQSGGYPESDAASRGFSAQDAGMGLNELVRELKQMFPTTHPGLLLSETQSGRQNLAVGLKSTGLFVIHAQHSEISRLVNPSTSGEVPYIVAHRTKEFTVVAVEGTNEGSEFLSKELIDVSEAELTDLFCLGIDGSRVPVEWHRSDRPDENSPASRIADYNSRGLRIHFGAEQPPCYSAVFSNDETFVGFCHWEVPAQYDKLEGTYVLVRPAYTIAMPATTILQGNVFLSDEEMRKR